MSGWFWSVTILIIEVVSVSGYSNEELDHESERIGMEMTSTRPGVGKWKGDTGKGSEGGCGNDLGPCICSVKGCVMWDFARQGGVTRDRGEGCSKRMT